MKITLLGYGEVGKILAEDLAACGHALSAFDVRAAESTLQAHARALGVVVADSHAAAVRGAGLVISAVTPSQTIAVAAAAAAGIAPGAFFLDFNSASPGAKIEAARLISLAGGRYVEGAVMTSVPPYRIKVPLLHELGFAPKVASGTLGVASATKMCRSIMIKGLEAMVVESFTTARHYGVEDAVIASLVETFPAIDWERQGAYFFQRVIEHGRRRSEELREVAVTVQDAGLAPHSAAGTAARQAWVADLGDRGLFGVREATGFARSADWRLEADRILEHVNKRVDGL